MAMNDDDNFKQLVLANTREWNGFWYWLWGTGLTVGIMASLIQTGLGWAVVPLSWIPTGLIAALAYPRRPRPTSELGWSDTTTGQGER